MSKSIVSFLREQSRIVDPPASPDTMADALRLDADRADYEGWLDSVNDDLAAHGYHPDFDPQNNGCEYPRPY